MLSLSHRIEKEEAVEALRAAAWVRDGSDDEKLRDLARWLVSMDDPEDVLGREERRSVTLTAIIERARAALGQNRRMVHNFAHAGGMALGADQDLDEAIARVMEADEVAWVSHSMGHDLAVRVGDRVYYYDVKRPQ